MVYFLFLLWFGFLIKWADFLIEWASNIAKKFNISDFFIWLTIIAIWTSLPELVVNIQASIQNSQSLLLWNIIGSNIANLLLILWVTATILPIITTRLVLKREYIISILSILLLFLFINNGFIFSSSGLINKYESLILLIIYMLFVYFVYKKSKNATIELVKIEVKNLSIKKSIIYIILGLIWLIVWWNRVVNWAIKIAEIVGISERVIWLTIIAIWTSLPELITSIVAVFKKKSDIALWNIIGSNIANILLVLGISWLINPIKINNINTQYDIIFLFLVSILVYLFFIRNKFKISKFEWVSILILYLLYIINLFFK